MIQKLALFVIGIFDYFYQKKIFIFLKKRGFNHINLFLDVGAHRGESIKLFLNNLNINIYNFGLSNSNSETEIWYTNKDKMGGSAIFDKNDPELKKYKNESIIKEKILIKKLDDLIHINNQEILIKIDVERHELNVLKGIKDLLTNNKCLIQIEIFDKYFNEVSKIMEDYKYIQFFKVQHNYEVNLSDYYFKNY